MKLSIRTMVASLALVLLGTLHTDAQAQFFGGFGQQGFGFKSGTNSGSFNRNGNGWNAQYRGPNGAASGHYQGGSRPTITGSYRDRQGNSGFGTVNRDRIAFDQRSSNGTRYNGYGYRNNTGWGVGGGYRNSNGTAYHGGIQQQSGRTSISGGYRNPMGTSYGGGIQHQGGRTTVQGQVVKPGPIPGTRTKTYGQVDLNGRNSRVAGGQDLYVGRLRVGGSGGEMDRRRATIGTNAGVGSVRYSTSQSVDFRGLNSQYQYNQSYRVGSANAGGGVKVDRRGVSGSATVGAFGKSTTVKGSVKVPSTPKVKIPSRTTVKLPSAPKVKTPSLPKVKTPSVPKVKTPSVPKVKVPSAPKISTPSFRSPF